MRTGAALVAGVTGLSLLLTGCPSGGSDSGRGPRSGGTLRLVGQGDVDYLDPNIGYYPLTSLALRMFSRNLLAYAAVPGAANTTPVPDLATSVPSRANGGVSEDGRTVTVRIVDGARWDTSPPRQVTARDAIRGVLRTCNPANPSGGLVNFRDLLVGLADFCDRFAEVATTVRAMRRYVESHLTSVPGLQVGADDRTVVFHLVRPTSYFVSMLTLNAFAPVPREVLDHRPGSPALARALPSDGPYRLVSYEPNRSLVFARNPVWQRAADPVRRAFVDKIVIDEQTPPDAAYQQIRGGQADLPWPSDLGPEPDVVERLLARRDPHLLRARILWLDPYLVFNTVSPNNDGLMQNRTFRRALQHAINRARIVDRALGGPVVSPPVTHVLPAGVSGAFPDFDLYRYDPERARALLRRAGAGDDVTLRVLYRPSDAQDVTLLRLLTNDLARIGIRLQGVASSESGFWTQFLKSPDSARRGLWDLSSIGWGPDWYGDAAVSYLGPLFGDRGSFPPRGANYGRYESSATQSLLRRAAATASAPAAARLWHRADAQVMRDAVVFPISSPVLGVYVGRRVRHAAVVPSLTGVDPTNVWLAPSGEG